MQLAEPSVVALSIATYLDEVEHTARDAALYPHEGFTAGECDIWVARARVLQTQVAMAASPAQQVRQAWAAWDWFLRHYAGTWLAALGLDASALAGLPPVVGPTAVLGSTLRTLHDVVLAARLPFQELLREPLWWTLNYACQYVAPWGAVQGLYFDRNVGLGALTARLYRTALTALPLGDVVQRRAILTSEFLTFLKHSPGPLTNA